MEIKREEKESLYMIEGASRRTHRGCTVQTTRVLTKDRVVTAEHIRLSGPEDLFDEPVSR